jgi:HK97 family phage portal protein
MSIIERLRAWLSGERRAVPDWARADLPWADYADATTSPMRISAVWACVRIIADTVASLPLVLYRRRGDGSRERAIAHPLYALLHDAPNPLMTAYEMRWAMVAHLALRGNAYAEIQRDGAGRVAALWPLLPDYMRVEVTGDAVRYIYAPPGRAPATLPAADVWHLRVFSLDGLTGLSPIAHAQRAIELAGATEEFGLRFFKQGANPRIALKHPGRLSPDAAQRLRESWSAAYSGMTQAHRVAILEEGMSIERITIAPEEAQFLQTRRMQIEEIARIYRIPPHMLGILERATHANIEYQQIEFLTQSLRPWLVCIEQGVSRLLRADERAEYYAEHLVDGLLRGDIGARYRAYATAIQWGWMSVNEVRARENMDAIAGGDAHLRPLNMTTVRDGEEGVSSNLGDQSTG